MVLNLPSNLMRTEWILLESHLDAIKKASLFINTDDCFISHAGISKHF